MEIYSTHYRGRNFSFFVALYCAPVLFRLGDLLDSKMAC